MEVQSYKNSEKPSGGGYVDDQYESAKTGGFFLRQDNQMADSYNGSRLEILKSTQHTLKSAYNESHGRQLSRQTDGVVQVADQERASGTMS